MYVYIASAQRLLHLFYIMFVGMFNLMIKGMIKTVL